MKSVKTNRPVVVGIFIFIGIAILVLAVFTLGGQKKTFVKGFQVNAVFDDVSGLVAGNNVWLSGVKIGTVKKISFLNNTKVLVTMVLQKSLEPNIKKDAMAKISSDGLIGNKIVVIFGGTASAPPAKDGEYLKVQSLLNTEDMLMTLQENNKNLIEITGSFKSISKKIDSGRGVIGSLLNDEAMARNIKGSVNGLQATMNNFQAVSQRSKAVLANLDQFTATLNTKGSLANELATDTSMFKVIQGTLTQLRDVTITAGQITNNLKAASDQLHKDDNAAGVLLNDKESAATIKQTLSNLQSSSQKLEEDLEAVQHNFLFRRYFKKKDKEAKNARYAHYSESINESKATCYVHLNVPGNFT